MIHWKLPRESTSIAKGIAILLVLCSHLHIPDGTGTWGVAIFLFLSGYGVMESYLKYGLSSYISKRFSHVYWPFILITAIVVAIDSITGRAVDFPNLLLSILLLTNLVKTDPSLWFIQFIIVYYLAFYAAFKAGRNTMQSCLMMFLLSLILFVLYANLSKSPAFVMVQCFQFPLGVAVSIICNSKNEFVTTRNLLIITFALSIAIISVAFIFKKPFIIELIRINIATVVVVAITSRIRGVVSGLLGYIGDLSFDIYLVEWLVISKYPFIHGIIQNQLPSIAICFIEVMLVAILFAKTRTLVALNIRSAISRAE